MSAEKERAFRAISAVIDHLDELAQHYDGLLPDNSGLPDPDECRGLKHEWLAALAGDYSRVRFAERIADAHAAAGPAGIPLADLESRLKPVLDVAGPLFMPGAPPNDSNLSDRLRHALNALIALRDHHCRDAVRRMHNPADAGASARAQGDHEQLGLDLFTLIRQVERGPDDRELSDRELALLASNLARPELLSEMKRHESRHSRIIGTSCAEAIEKANRIVAFNRHLRGETPVAVPLDRPATAPAGGRISRVDLPEIAQSIRDLYRAIDNPPRTPFTQPDWWERVPPALNCRLPENGPPAHSWLIGCAMQALQYRLQAGNFYDNGDCPEIADSDLDQREKAKLLELREYLCGANGGRFFLSPRLANSQSDAIQFKEYLLDVLGVIGNRRATASTRLEAPTHDVLSVNGRRTMEGALRALRELWWDPPEGAPPTRPKAGPARDPASFAELRELCLVWRFWIGRRRERNLNYSPLGQAALAAGDDHTQTIRAVWEHVVRLAGHRPYPAMDAGPFPTDRALAALDRVVEWCDSQAASAAPQASPITMPAVPVVRPTPASIHIPTVAAIIRDLIPAVEQDDYPTISAKREELRAAIAPNPGLTDREIQASELPETTKRVLRRLRSFIYRGAQQFRDQYDDGLDLLNEVLAEIAPSAIPDAAADPSADVTDLDGDPLAQLRTMHQGSAGQIANAIGVPLSTVEPFLRRLRDRKPSCFFPVEGDFRRATDPKYIYRVPEILSDLERALSRWRRHED